MIVISFPLAQYKSSELSLSVSFHQLIILVFLEGTPFILRAAAAAYKLFFSCVVAAVISEKSTEGYFLCFMGCGVVPAAVSGFH